MKGEWVYLYRAVDAAGQTIDFLLSPKRNSAAARRFFRKALKQPHTVNPRTITVDKNAAYPITVGAMKRGGELWRFARLRQVKVLTDVFDKPFFGQSCYFSRARVTTWLRAGAGMQARHVAFDERVPVVAPVHPCSGFVCQFATKRA